MLLLLQRIFSEVLVLILLYSILDRLYGWLNIDRVNQEVGQQIGLTHFYHFSSFYYFVVPE